MSSANLITMTRMIKVEFGAVMDSFSRKTSRRLKPSIEQEKES